MTDIKMLIVTVVLALLFLICGFGLSFVHNAFAVVALYCGFTALFCAVIFFDLREGNQPKLIRLGSCIVLLSLLICGTSDRFRYVSIPLTVIFGLAGAAMVVNGFKEWNKRKKPQKKPLKQPWNPPHAGTNKPIVYCAGCKKNITDEPRSKVYEIEGAKFCRQCKREMDREYESANIVCSVCGAKISSKEIYLVDDALFCGKCFRKQYGS